ncbi:response regulator [Lentibacter sp. XHP0401]|jgi:DNA-binding response OmpR family regulator|uniref:response regulator n=1 Tax=Lentibacter sp. XHP0401 TaxID=2984334 RepID=UPI0021E800AC|nr:response regulator [Lentibacter sp. XHP0401]MCV2894235.1 response regulator [Lentibacter sp. XHP0401]
MKILAVDDDRVSLDLLELCLTGGGYEQVTLMSSPLEALRNISEAEIAYDCILLDVEMPERNGIQLCADIRRLARYHSTPILMITKHQDHAAVERAFASGATDYIAKPFEFFEVLTRIRVAERLVQERQAAIDSYIAVQRLSSEKQKKTETLSKSKLDTVLSEGQFQVTGEYLLPHSFFQNYLERATRSDDCDINLIAMKIGNIDRIFEQTKALEFVDFLKAAADAMHYALKSDKTFMTHAGNGVFLGATRGLKDFDALTAETEILRSMENEGLPLMWRPGAQPEPIVGTPLPLTAMAKLNFRRASKAAIARMEKREKALGGLGLAALVG